MGMLRIGVIYVCAGCHGGVCCSENQRLIRTMLAGLGKVVDFAVVGERREALSLTLSQFVTRSDIDLLMAVGGDRQWWQTVGRSTVEAATDGDYRQLTAVVGDRLGDVYTGRRDKMVVVSAPGNPRGVQECLELLVPPLEEGLSRLRGEGHWGGQSAPLAGVVH
ncbi:MAG: hypothetical protein N3A57_07540 [Negativicutes bacterium]|nr:hypothetical protein [Negativicutes bacterium]